MIGSRDGRLRRVLRRWRGSIQVRVVFTTVLLGTTVVIVVGSVLLARISVGLVTERRDSAERDSLQQYQEARMLIQSHSIGDDPSQMANDLVSRLQGPADSPTRKVLLLPVAPVAGQVQGPGPGPRASAGVTRSMLDTLIPQTLRAQVNENPAVQQSAIVSLPSLEATSAGGTPAIAVGALIDLGANFGGIYELYFVYPLDNEVQTLDLVRKTFLVGGALLVLLVGGVAYIVTRQVVAPVRQAAQTAEELAAGNLDRRMVVRGEDDLARLAQAFNDMAVSLQSQISQLENLSLVQRQFVSDVSHELRTPLTTIRMAGELIFDARGAFDPAIKRSSELLHAQLDRFEALLGDLLEVSRFDAGAAVLDAEPTDLRDIVQTVVDGFGPLVDRKGGELAVFAPDEPCIADIDRRRIARIVRNLVGNAIEHGEGVPIQVTVAEHETAVAVSVRDHGVGLKPEQVRMVFHRFWRADPARARTTGGTGLGLAISLEDAHLHGGALGVWGAPKLGAHFVLTVPKRAGDDIVESPIPLVPDLPDVEGADEGLIGESYSGLPTSATVGPE